MDRRDFIKKVGGTAVGLTVVPGAIIASRLSPGMDAPYAVSKVMTLVSRETVGAVKRSVVKSMSLENIMIIKARQTGMTDLQSRMVHWKEFRKIGKLQYYEPKSFF